MSIAIIPESAPFNAEQRAWLNGFLAGWMGLQEAPGSGSVSATNRLPEALKHAEDAEDFPWHDPALSIEERLTLAEDRPIERRLMAAMAQLDCGACGYLCQTYSEAIARGEERNLKLCSPGGNETSKALKRLLKDVNGQAVVHESSTNGSAPPAPIVGSRKQPIPARVLRSVNLNRPGSEKQTHHVEIDLADSGLTYNVGDSLGVYPVNCPDLVAAVLQALGASGDESILMPSGQTVLIHEALSRQCCLATPTEELLDRLAGSARDDLEASALRDLIRADSLPSGWDVLDLLQRFPSARLDPAEFTTALAELRPRLYSIASSLARHPGQVHLTIGRACCTIEGRLRKGVASTMFADRLNEGDAVRVFVQPSHGFTVPADPTAPMIMVGPGTGIAPFRAFLQERAASGATGRNWLFFGDQRRAYDFLYQEEFEGYLREGILARLDTAFSRDGEGKVYVQHRMAEAGAELFQWLEAGASFFVCGDARRMAADVDQALRAVVQEQGNMSASEAKAYVSALASNGRYCRDVY
ncbi:sulfite reductase subunit alpha [soil metagenome]